MAKYRAHIDNRAYLAEASSEDHGWEVRIQHPDGGYELVGYFSCEAEAARTIDTINGAIRRAETTHVGAR